MKILCTEMNCYPSKAMILLGYSDSTMSHWKGEGKVPLAAMNALTGVLSELKPPSGITSQPVELIKHIALFTLPQLTALLMLLIGHPISNETIAELREILIAEIGRVAK